MDPLCVRIQPPPTRIHTLRSEFTPSEVDLLRRGSLARLGGDAHAAALGVRVRGGLGGVDPLRVGEDRLAALLHGGEVEEGGGCTEAAVRRQLLPGLGLQLAHVVVRVVLLPVLVPQHLAVCTTSYCPVSGVRIQGTIAVWDGVAGWGGSLFGRI
eukprot:1178433-Prorocentrum_minimum.AAC.5